MASAVDPAIAEALGLDPATARMTSHGGSGFSSTFRLDGKVDGKGVCYFVKTGTGEDAEVMFRGEWFRGIRQCSCGLLICCFVSTRI
jgi:protein-ribulosamine 3-kinase